MQKLSGNDEGEEVCNCDFSLAYGAMLLLSHTNLRLVRGQRYGLLGPNGAGKSTLMKAIANGQLNGFPSADKVRTIYVGHDLQGADASEPPVNFVLNGWAYEPITLEEVHKTLVSVGFTEDRLLLPVVNLSGGWKMKLELARAMLMKADVLLLDEPTNHLDVANVAWLVKYLTSLTQVTTVIVSHDSGFLDNTITYVIHYEKLKLKQYKGNLSEFVKVKPEARTYYELQATNIKYIFPKPGLLDGVKNPNKPVLRMQGVNFTYPGTTRVALENINVSCSLSSRIAVIGPNGAGKSTMIKVLTGEIVPQNGQVYKHPTLRLSYVAQHAFHHVEQHLDKSPNEYISWRFQHGDDKEVLEKASRQISDEEKAQMERLIDHEDPRYYEKYSKKRVEVLMGRRKYKKTYEYEVKWLGLNHKYNSWIVRDDLQTWGFAKLLQAYDDREAMNPGIYYRPLTPTIIQKHLNDFGLDAEFGTHGKIRGLSGGQKVKVVLAAAFWNNPHMIVLDEPTNYLDRDSLGALAGAIKDFAGGVIIISHNSEFTSGLCPERWNVVDGKLTIEGKSSTLANKEFEDLLSLSVGSLDLSNENSPSGSLQNGGESGESTPNVSRTSSPLPGSVPKVKKVELGMGGKKLSRKDIKERERKRHLASLKGKSLSSDEDEQNAAVRPLRDKLNDTVFNVAGQKL